MDDKWAEHIAAQLWCRPEHEHKVMDCDFAASIAAALRKAKADGMKEAAEYISTLDYRVHVRELNDRASQIEKGNCE